MVELAISRSFRHIGIVYSDPETGENRFAHLWWHMDLRNDDLREIAERRYFRNEPNIDQLFHLSVAGWIRRIFLRNPKGIPYAGSNPDGAFDASGQFQDSEDLLGLTCATFVLAVFMRVGAPLADLKTWNPRAGDVEFFEHVIAQMEADGDEIVSKEHIAKLRNEANRAQARYRPLEVFGAGLCKSLPATFARAKKAGDKFEEANKAK